MVRPVVVLVIAVATVACGGRVESGGDEPATPDTADVETRRTCLLELVAAGCVCDQSGVHAPALPESCDESFANAYCAKEATCPAH